MIVEDMQLVANYILKQENKQPVMIYIKNARCSHAEYRTDKIRIAKFIFNYPEEIQLAEVIHEVCHFAAKYCHHNSFFRQKEIYWLSQFGLKPVKYRRAYYTFIQTLNGQLILTRSSKYTTKDLEEQKHVELSKTLKQKVKKIGKITL